MPPPEMLHASDPAEASLWERLVSDSVDADIYYRPNYARAYEFEGEGRAVAVRVKTPDAAFLFPCLLRPLSSLPFAAGAAGQDAVTPYGYGGLLSLRPAHPTPAQLRAGITAFAQWCKSQGIISVLLRLHPLLEQDQAVAQVADLNLWVHLFGPTIAIDLGNWSEASLRKGRRSDLAVARRSLRITWSSARHPSAGAPPLPEALGLFRGLYESTMDRLGASAFYHFSPAYYAALADGLGEGMAVALAWREQQAVGGSIFLADRRFAHYHLSATNEDGRALKATTLLIREAVDWARSRGCRRLHLGGGVSGDDSLFDFKKGFGGDVYQYAFAGLICDPLRYQELLDGRLASGGPLRPNYFPGYRA